MSWMRPFQDTPTVRMISRAAFEDDNFRRIVKILYNFESLILGLQIFAEVFEDNGMFRGRWMSYKVEKDNLGGFDLLG